MIHTFVYIYEEASLSILLYRLYEQTDLETKLIYITGCETVAHSVINAVINAFCFLDKLPRGITFRNSLKQWSNLLNNVCMWKAASYCTVGIVNEVQLTTICGG